MVDLNILDDPKTIWPLLAELARKQSELGTNGKSALAKRLIHKAKSQFTPVALESLAYNDPKFPKGTYLHLPPDEKGGLPVLKASFDTQNGHTVFRIKAAILVEHGGDEKEHSAIGVRFEGPEGPGKHNYFHAQWFSSFEKGSARLPGCPVWLPDSHPAIPIPAKSAVDILCCALKSFYGAKSEPLNWLAEMVKKPGYRCRVVKERIKYWFEEGGL